MFIGHYGLGFMVKKEIKKVPLWLLFLSVQLMDIVAFILALFGIEKSVYRSSTNPFLTNDLDLPYSHSLVSAFLLIAIMYGILVIAKRKSWTLIAALCVLSHWMIDSIVHTPHYSIICGCREIGFELWNHPYISFGLEIILVLMGWLILGYKNAVSFLLLFLLIVGFTGMVFGNEPDAIKNNEALRTLIVLVSNILFIVLAYFSERLQRNKTS